MMSQMKRKRDLAKALCKLNNTKHDKEPEIVLSETGRDSGTLKGSQEEGSEKDFGHLKGCLRYHFLESLILAQDERWRRV